MAQPAHASASPWLLPLDVLLNIVESLVSDSPNVIFAPGSPTTTTLLALTQVCHAVSPLATRLLWRHCAYIDSPKKLLLLNQALSANHQNLVQLFLSPFPDVSEPFDDLDDGNGLGNDADCADDGLSYSRPSPLNNLPLCQAVYHLFKCIAPTLRRLIIDIPLRSLYPEDDHQSVRPFLRHGFSALVNLEEFVSVQDELYLSIAERRWHEPPVWATCWPKLRRLALYNPVIDTEDAIWDQMARLAHLEMAIFARADGSGDPPEGGDDSDLSWAGLQSINIKKEWLRALQVVCTGEPDYQRPTEISLVLTNCAEFQPRFPRFHASWRAEDPSDLVKVMLADVPLPDGCVGIDLHHNVCPILLTQNFLKSHAMASTLWDINATWMRTAPTQKSEA